MLENHCNLRYSHAWESPLHIAVMIEALYGMLAFFKLYFIKGFIFQTHFKEVFFIFKKTRVRQIIYLLQKNLSGREIFNVLGVSRNSLARGWQTSDGYSGEWEELLMMTDNELYRFFYSKKSNPKSIMPQLIILMFTVNLVKLALQRFSCGKNTVRKCKLERLKSCSYPTFARGYKKHLSAGIIPAM